MSSTSSGRAERRATTDDIRSWSMTGSSAPVHVTTTSAVASSSASRREATTRPPVRAASAAPRSGVRLATTSSATPRPASATAAASPTSPAPTTTTFDRLKRPEALLGHLDRGLRDGRGAPADPGLRPRPLAHLERPPEEQVERRAGRALPLGQLPCVADLAEDLGLPEHGRAQAGGHLEQVGGRLLVVLADEVEGAARRAPTRPARRRSRGCRRTRRGSARWPHRPRCGCRSRAGPPRRGSVAAAGRPAPWPGRRR